MAVLYSYPIKSTPANRDDLVVISDSRDGNKTKQIAVANLPGSASFSGIGGSGTVNYIPKFSTSTDLVNSTIYEESSNIGIGTTSPVFKLDVAGNARASYFALRSNESSPAESAFIYRPETGVIGFGTASAERIRITSIGLVGIGTVTPGEKLEVAGKVKVTGANNFLTTIRNSAGQANYIRFFNTATSVNEAYIGFTSNNKDLKFQNLDATGTLTFGSGGAIAMSVDASQNVGIGTTSPLEKLDVRGVLRIAPNYPGISAVQTGIILKDPGAGSNEGLNIEFQSGSDNNTAFIGSISYDQLRIGTAGEERMRINSAGDVGIGTTIPAAKLDILDTVDQTSIRVTNNNYNNYLIQKRRTDNSQVLGIQEFGSNGGLSLVTGGSQRLNVNNLGNVGIGTTAPNDGDLTIGTPSLHVATAGTSGTFNLAARFQSTTIDADNTGTSILINSSNDRGLLIKAGRKDSDREVAYFDVVSNSGNTTNMLTMGKFDSAYNVGIGTTVPDSILTVKAAAANVGIPVIKSSVNGFANGFTIIGDNYVKDESQFNLGISYSGANGVLSRGVKVSNTTDDVFLSSQDAYSTNPNAFILDRDGSFRFLNTSTNASTPVGTAVSLSERMRIDKNGNVGIGTTNPTADGLEVATRASISGGNTELFITGSTTGRSVLGLGDGSNRFVQHILTDHTQNIMSFHTAASSITNNERMRIASDGKVGIATTAPVTKLTVGVENSGVTTRPDSASTGFESLIVGTITFPAAAGYYRVAQYPTAVPGVSEPRGGASLDLLLTGGSFSPTAYSIDFFKFYTQSGTNHTLKLAQYGVSAFITKARLAVQSNITYLEIYKAATSVDMPTRIKFNRLHKFNGGSTPLYGTATSGAGSTSMVEVSFIPKGTSVEALRVEGGNLNLKNLPTSNSGLAAGDIYNDGGTLKIVS
tara:strand:- start:214 stop:2991 length:2778 start_codon:yes stop_codon:yes gene_type:complete